MISGGKSMTEKLTAREREILRKVLHVIFEFEFDCDSDIEGCSGDELAEIEAHLMCCTTLKRRITNYITKKVDNPRGVKDGEKPMTKRPKIQ